MKTLWKITHDPMRLTEDGVDFGPLEEAAREQGEDIVQAQRLIPNKKVMILDLGWYQSRYLVDLVEGTDGESPIQRIECRDLASAMAAFRKLAV